jgi:hypothetical protein
MLKNGKKVTTASDWWNKRRPEIAEDFDREVYARVPAAAPKVNWQVTSVTNGKMGCVDIVTKQLVAVVDNSIDPDIEVKIALSLTTPAHAIGPVPVIMPYGGVGSGGRGTESAGPPYGPNAFAPPAPGRGPALAGASGAGRGDGLAAGFAGLAGG